MITFISIIFRKIVVAVTAPVIFWPYLPFFINKSTNKEHKIIAKSSINQKKMDKYNTISSSELESVPSQTKTESQSEQTNESKKSLVETSGKWPA